MHQQFLTTSVLATALLFSQGGSFLIAALCPHLRSGMASCEMQLSARPMPHADMAHEDMGHTGHMEMSQEAKSNLDPKAVALSQPNGPCSHCAAHSRTTPSTASLRQGEQAKRSIDLNIPLQVSRVAPVTESPVPVLTSRAHGPPGEPTARHILINIFRI
jgi:hypothetical protein